MVDKIVMLGIEKVFPPGDMIRARIDADVIRELGESIRERGLLMPIIVVKSGDGYEVVAGHRRLLAHRLIGADKIKAIVRDLSEEDIVLTRATENLQREDLSPIEEAKVYGRLRDKLHMTTEEIARKMGKNRMTIKKYLKLIEFPEDVQELIDRKALPMEVAFALVDVADQELRKYYVTMAVENGVTAKVARMWVDDWKASSAGRFYEDRGGVPIEQVKTSPTPIYVTCFMCHGPTDVYETTTVQMCRECYNSIILSRTKGGVVG